MNDKLLEMKDVTIGSPKSDHPIVDRVSITVRKQSITGIVGESGCGKSMTSLAVMNLLPTGISILSGSIRLEDQELCGFSEKEFRSIRGDRISMIFQEPVRALHPLHRVGKQIEENLRVHKKLSKEEYKAKTLELMRSVGIPNPELRYHQYPHQLSGGLNQRVMIAMAIAGDPSLLIADEPTTALDVTIQAQILKLLRSLRHTLGISMILISHDLAVICENCDDIYVMYCGQVVESASTKTLFQSPKHPYTRALIQASPDPGKKVEVLPSIPGTVPSADQIPKGCRFADRCRFCEKHCREKAPELYTQSDGSAVRCFRFEQEEKHEEHVD